MELNITEANSNYMIVNANRLRGKGYEYTMGKATFINETTAELYGSIGFPSEGALVPKKFKFYLVEPNIIMEEYDTFGNLEDSYTSVSYTHLDVYKRQIRDWAAFHHEKLNGKGYPFGKTADELNEQERMMACVDIYQALTEDRPYKKGLSHEKTCDILDDMAHKDFIDSDISKTIRECFGRT